MKKNKNRRWKRRWAVLDYKNLYVFKNPQDSNEPKIIDLFCASVKQVKNVDREKFEVVTKDDTHEFYCETEKDLLHWIGLVSEVCQNLVHQSIGSPDKPRLFRKVSVRKISNPDPLRPQNTKLIEFLALPENSVCADCSAPKPEWASTNLGVFICIACSGAHRSLGTHISKVRSVHLDDWDPEQVAHMLAIGNKKANEHWEHNLPANAKISEKDTVTAKIHYITTKYVKKEFAAKESKGDAEIFLQWENDKSFLGFVPDVDTDEFLATFRSSIEKNGLLTGEKYIFLFKKAPVTAVQETKKHVKDCLVTFEGNPTLQLRRELSAPKS
eukprot:TRINITY_DN5643_c0_g1_i3.p2 TRINITY_DN5643_c0_g1~~TRINITY_DN5643_c0_g1_i3.p2  ORF type:complete len:327 (+),score=109.95 TRINITY_DN5643_c0_g1_i3:1109-2089(+)